MTRRELNRLIAQARAGDEASVEILRSFMRTIAPADAPQELREFVLDWFIATAPIADSR